MPWATRGSTRVTELTHLISRCDLPRGHGLQHAAAILWRLPRLLVLRALCSVQPADVFSCIAARLVDKVRIELARQARVKHKYRARQARVKHKYRAGQARVKHKYRAQGMEA